MFTFLIWLLPILSDNSNRALHMQNPWGRDLQTPGVGCQIYFFTKHSHSLLVVPAHIWVCASPSPFCAVGQLLNIISLKLTWFIVDLYLSYGFSVYHLKVLPFCNIKQTLCQVDFHDKLVIVHYWSYLFKIHSVTRTACRVWSWLRGSLLRRGLYYYCLEGACWI